MIGQQSENPQPFPELSLEFLPAGTSTESPTPHSHHSRAPTSSSFWLRAPVSTKDGTVVKTFPPLPPDFLTEGRRQRQGHDFLSGQALEKASPVEASQSKKMSSRVTRTGRSGRDEWGAGQRVSKIFQKFLRPACPLPRIALLSLKQLSAARFL